MLCSEQRKKRVSGIGSPNKKAQSISAGLLLRYCLLKKGYCDSDIKLLPSGKPYIEGNPIYFSLSHSGEYAVCITENKPVGVDIQKLVNIKERTAERFCSFNHLNSNSLQFFFAQQKEWGSPTQSTFLSTYHTIPSILHKIKRFLQQKTLNLREYRTFFATPAVFYS